MSNKKLTTEEKIVRSQLYSEEIESLKKRLAEKKAAQNKLDKEIALEQEKQWKHDMRLLGEKVVSLIGGNFKQEQYTYMLEYVFEMDEVKEFIADEKSKLKTVEESVDTLEEENPAEADNSPNAVSA